MEFAAEHGDEGAGAGVAGFEGDVGDGLAGSEEFQGVNEAEALAPLLEGDAGLGAEEAFDGASARASALCDGRKRYGGGGIGFENVGDSEGARIFGHFELEWDGGEGVELIEDYVDQVGLRGDGGVERADGDGLEDQFAEEWGDVHSGAVSAIELRELRDEVERAGFYRAGVDFGVLDAGGNPDGAVGRDDPGGVGGLDAENALGGVGELVPFVGVGFEDLATGEGDAEGADQDGAVEAGVG